MEDIHSNRQAVQWHSGANILVGIWLFIAAAVMGYAEQEAVLWNEMVIGAAIALLALIRAAFPLKFEGLSWINFVLGAWLVLAPFIMGYVENSAFWNDIIVGVIVLLLAGSSAMTTEGARSGKE